jgi:hypothetical protein
MINLNLTDEESKMTCGLLQSVLEMVAANREESILEETNTTALMISVLGKLETELEHQLNNN